MSRGGSTQCFRANVSGCKVAVSEDVPQLKDLRSSNATTFALCQVTGLISYLMVIHPSQEIAFTAIRAYKHQLRDVSLRAANFGKRIFAMGRK